jgi:uncharacterized phage-associated protein
MPQKKLQKLTFIANGWNLAITNQPLVDEEAEAWDNGPVFRDIWSKIRDLGTDARGQILDYGRNPVAENLTPVERQVVEHVWRKYGSFSADTLSDMTHQEGTPWTNAYFGRGRNARIRNDEVREHYRGIALAGRTTAA